MAGREQQALLSELSVKKTMRRQVVRLAIGSPLHSVIRHFIKYKINALLIDDEAGLPAGVVSKTDLMGAYYAGLPTDTPAGDIMVSPPICCHPEEKLDVALNRMREHAVFRLFVRQGDEPVEGVLAYPDIVGLLYKFCYTCRHNKHQRAIAASGAALQLKVADLMTASPYSFRYDDSLATIVEGLSAYRFGAVLIVDDQYGPAGVVSKSDLILAYKRGVDLASPASAIMSSPVACGCETDPIESTIRTMVFDQAQRIFVYRDNPRQITGVLSLSDTARIRSGSCQACVSSRIRLETELN